jgi:hypothetical protein
MLPSVAVSVSAEGDEHPRNDLSMQVAAAVEQYIRDQMRGNPRNALRRISLALSTRSSGRPARSLDVQVPDVDVRFRLTSTSPLALRTGLGDIRLHLREVHKIAVALLAHRTPGLCICAAVGGPGGAGYTLYEPQVPPDPATGEWVSAIFVLDIFGNQTDAIRMQMPQKRTMAPNQTEIVLRVGDPNLPHFHKWAKEVYAWSVCRGRTLSARHPGNGAPETVLRVTRAQCMNGDADTIAFAKPGVFGAWTDVFHWTIDSFWPPHAGRRVIYTWIK